MASIMEMFTLSLSAAAGWFNRLLTASSVSGVFLSMIFIYLMFKFLLRPIFGRSAGSDTVQRKNQEAAK